MTVRRWTVNCLQNPVSMSVDADIQREHAYQREHLEKTVSALKKRLTSDNQHHHDDNVRVMQVRRPLYIQTVCDSHLFVETVNFNQLSLSIKHVVCL